MTPPEAPETGTASAGMTPPAASVCADDTGVKIATLRKRPDFLRAAAAGRQGTGSMMVQARKRGADECPDAPGLIRVGFTCSKKIGNAVARNRAKRRLRAAAQQVMPQHGQPGWDYVLIGRAGATGVVPFDTLLADLTRAVTQLNKGKSLPPRQPKHRK